VAGPAPRRRPASCSSTEHSARVRLGARHKPPATSGTLAPYFRKDKPRLRRYRRRTNSGLLPIDQAAVQREAHVDGKWLIRIPAGPAPPTEISLDTGLRPFAHRGQLPSTSAFLFVSRLIGEHFAGTPRARTSPPAPE
jgi:hypothetical protein